MGIIVSGGYLNIHAQLSLAEKKDWMKSFNYQQRNYKKIFHPERNLESIQYSYTEAYKRHFALYHYKFIGGGFKFNHYI